MLPLDPSPNPATLWSQPYALTGLLTFLLSVGLGSFVLWKNPRNPTSRRWAMMCYSVAAWAGWNTLSLLSASPAGSLKYLRIADAFALFIPITFLHFAMHFSGQMRPSILRIGYAITALLVLTASTPWFVQAGQKKFGIWFEVGGPAFALFAIIFVVFSAYGIYLLYRTYRQSAGTRRAQLLSLILACFLGFGGGFMWFPPAFGIDIPPLGGHLVALYCVIAAYAILRYRFLDIGIVIRRSIVYSALVTLLTVGYFGLVYGIERIFQATFGYRSAGVSLAAFALMALAFQPLKVWIQRWVDWLIFRVPQEELAKRLERLEKEALQAEKLKAISTLAAGMAHEIKNPLTAIKAFSESVPELHSDPEFIKRYTEIIPGEIRRIQNIVQDVLGFAKPKPPQLKLVDLGRLINSTADLLSGELLKRHVKWQIDCQHNGVTLQADPDQLRQVLINLIQNAADAMPEGGNLTITTQTNKGYLEIIVSDTGKGIRKDLLPKIFDPFVTTKEHGNGLGLAMVHSIIQSHRGTIQAESYPGRGTTFMIKLPL